MRSHLEVYPCRLTALGPVFIGKGSELSKKEYLFLDGRKTAGVVDIEKLYGAAVRNGLGKHFETYMMDPRDKRNLGQWVREEGLSGQEVRSCLKYAVDSGDTVIQRGTPVQIVECIKDPYGLPYIPGSSIKGMLRTILLAGRILKDPGKFDRDREQVLKTVRNTYGNVKRTFLQAERRSVEQNGFYSLNRNERRREDAVNDELSGMIVSDSRPLKLKDLVLCQKVEYHRDGAEKRLNLLRECIRPGTTVEFTITIEKDICSVGKEEILRGIEAFNQVYYDCFLRAFRTADRPLPGQVYLGGGTGFASKTVIYPLLGRIDGLDTVIDIFRNTGVPATHKHEKDRQYGVSPHILKCTRFDGQLMEMGKCRLEIL